MEVKIIIPEEEYSMGEFNQDGFFGVITVNSSLLKFEPKLVFGWHLSIMITLEESLKNGMPVESDVKVVDDFEDRLDEILKFTNPQKQNALFLARITWNNSVELIWRIFDPEIANNQLKKIIENKFYTHFFDYRIDKDVNWELAEWHLNNFG